jgi:hypothetical protein
MLRKLIPLSAVTAFLVLALGPVGASANSASATISFAGNATLVSPPGPSPALVALHYSCLPPNPGFVQVTLDENGVTGFAFSPNAICDDRSHSLTLTVNGAFTPGTASGQAFVDNADGTSFAFVNSQISIK